MDHPIGDAYWDGIVAEPTLYAMGMSEVKARLEYLAVKETKMSADEWGTPEEVEAVLGTSETLADLENVAKAVEGLRFEQMLAEHLLPYEYCGFMDQPGSFPRLAAESHPADRSRSDLENIRSQDGSDELLRRLAQETCESEAGDRKTEPKCDFAMLTPEREDELTFGENGETKASVTPFANEKRDGWRGHSFL